MRALCCNVHARALIASLSIISALDTFVGPDAMTMPETRRRRRRNESVRGARAVECLFLRFVFFFLEILNKCDGGDVRCLGQKPNVVVVVVVGNYIQCDYFLVVSVFALRMENTMDHLERVILDVCCTVLQTTPW